MVVKCKNGHWYDPNMHRTCPHCKRASEQLRLTLDDVEEDDKTVSIADVDVSLGEQLEALDILHSTETNGNQVQAEIKSEQQEEDRTISFGFFGMDSEQPPVTGWFVFRAPRGEVIFDYIPEKIFLVEVLQWI